MVGSILCDILVSWSPCRQLNNWSACAVAQPESFILLAGNTSSWRSAVPGPVVFYPLRGCSLILHARPAKAWISLRIRAVWTASSLCALWKAGIIYIFYAAGEDFYLAASMRRLILVFTCYILVYCLNCCAPDNLLSCTLLLFFVA